MTFLEAINTKDAANEAWNKIARSLDFDIMESDDERRHAVAYVGGIDRVTQARQARIDANEAAVTIATAEGKFLMPLDKWMIDEMNYIVAESERYA